MNQRIPVIMFHSVGIVNKKWQWNHLTCPYHIFEDQLKWLKKIGYVTLDFQEVYDYISNDQPVPKNSVFLTFDDGYLDNYVFAYPLLKKYGMKGTIFVNPDFVDKSESCRKILTETDMEEDVKKLEYFGFCNWNELKRMDEEGVLDVQSHAKTHTWYPISNKIIDFRHPDDEFVWMDWNENPEQKPYLQYVNSNDVKYGQAVFEHKKALSSKRVFINNNFQSDLYSYVKNNGGITFFDNKKWKDKLKTYSNNLEKKYEIIEKIESHEDYLIRLRYELEYTKNELQLRLNKRINFLCWPGGSGTKEGVKISKELGYLMSTAAKDLSNDFRKKIINSPDQKINRISRITPVMYHNRTQRHNISVIRYSPGWFFILQLMRFQDKYYAGFWVKALHYLILKIKKKSE